ncbi:MAG: site-specific DNA-methyltransferase [Candidatus Nitrosopolaris sp.]
MPEIKSESIHLVVTSPPYWNLKKYGEEGIGLHQAYAKYLYDIQSVLKEIKRVIVPGRFVAINVGTAVSNNGMKSINADIVRMMEDLNFTFRKEIIWIKPKGTQGLWQRGVTKFLKNEPYPCFLSLNIMHEYILIFQNEGQIQIPMKTEHRLPEEFIKKVSWSVWEIGVSNTKGHPAPFPDEIPCRLIQLYTLQGETVLDPFGGSGTTMKVARNLKRNSVVYEINAAYIGLIKQNVGWNSILDLDTSYEIKIRKHIID